MSDRFNLLVKKLKEFNQQFYINELIKGLLIFIAITISLVILLSVSEYVGYFGSLTKKVLLFGYFGIVLALIYFFIIKPGFYLLQFHKKEEIEKAAIFLGKHFKNTINDKIVNTLQLSYTVSNYDHNIDLLIAGIDQKASELIFVPFKDSIDFRGNIKFFLYAVFITLFFLIGWFFYPVVFKESTQRLLAYNKEFIRPAPFQIVFNNNFPIEAKKNERLKIQIKIKGDFIPDKAFIAVKNGSFEMVKISKDEFEFEFRSIIEDFKFNILVENYTFGPYEVSLRNTAVIKNFVINAVYPDYTNLESEIFNNIGDLRVPIGTNLNWTLFTDDTNEALFESGGKVFSFENVSKEVFDFKKSTVDDFDYSIISYNDSLGRGDSLSYSIKVVADLFPTIHMVEFRDSILNSIIFYNGTISDDYGFTDLSFNYRLVDSKNRLNIPYTYVPIPFDVGLTKQDFNFNIDFSLFDLKGGDGVEYYFEVRDNDRINGPKFSRSSVYFFGVESFEDYIKDNFSVDEKIKDGLSTTKDEINSVQDEIDRLRRSMLETDDVSWEIREELNALLDKQEKIQNQFEDSKKVIEEKIKNDSQFDRADPDIMKKQEELEKLFNEVLSDELKELYEKIAEELQKLNRENIFDVLNKMQFELSDYENRLDRALELFKSLQVEKMLNDALRMSESIREQQKDVNLEMNNTGLKESSFDEQSEIDQRFDFLRELLEQVNQKNQELTRPNEIQETGSLEQDVKDQIRKALQSIKNSNVKDTDSSQKNVLKGLESLSKSLSETLANMQQKNMAEDIRSLREILDNLLKVSFGQEDLMERVKIVNIRDPHYVTLIQNQRKISTDLDVIKDSLQNLAKRQIQIQSIVNREIAEINLNVAEAIDHLVERRKHNGVARQQFVMTHVNNLALLLNESLQNMQMQMQGQGEGEMQQSSGQSMPDIRQMQEEMNRMLQELREGQQPMPGESGEGMGMSERLARMAAEQEQIRRRLNELANELKREGHNTGELEDVLRDMERTEIDIISQNINRQTQLRQQRILTRLLEHEKAMLEREQEEKRVGETAIFFELSNPELFFEYNRDKNRAIDLMRNLPPGFKQHYKSLVESYLLNVQE